MELKCPQCGKWMAVSQEELVIHDCQVVCPQCLAVCQYEGGQLVVRDDSDAPYRHTANADTVATEKSKFCHHCGKQLPSGISFCPYCGADLKAPFSPEEPKPEPKKPEPAPVQEKKRPVQEEKHPVSQPSYTPQPSQQSAMVEDKLRTMTHRYKSMHPHLHQNGTMPSKTFKLIAYAVIAILLILLIAIIFAGSSLDPTM